jgi:hypothetical protein
VKGWDTRGLGSVENHSPPFGFAQRQAPTRSARSFSFFIAVSHLVYRGWVEHAFQACITAVSSWIAL